MAKEGRGSFEEAVAREYDRMLRAIATGAATELGNRPDTVTLSPDDEEARWNYHYRNPEVTPEQLPVIATEIMTRITQSYQQAQKPLPDPEKLTLLVAAQVTRVQTKGMRRELVSRGYPEPKSQVDRAKSLARKYGEAEQMTTMPMVDSIPTPPGPTSLVHESMVLEPPPMPPESVAVEPTPQAPPAPLPAVRALTGGGI
jgi:hypothetical protein